MSNLVRWLRGERRRPADEAVSDLFEARRFSSWWTSRGKGVPRPGQRLVYTDPEEKRQQAEAHTFINNGITTSRYTSYNFVPLFLLEQFSRAPNIYFLAICVLQSECTPPCHACTCSEYSQ
jgi:hypothetical protein